MFFFGGGGFPCFSIGFLGLFWVFSFFGGLLMEKNKDLLSFDVFSFWHFWRKKIIEHICWLYHLMVSFERRTVFDICHLFKLFEVFFGPWPLLKKHMVPFKGFSY